MKRQEGRSSSMAAARMYVIFFMSVAFLFDILFQVYSEQGRPVAEERELFVDEFPAFGVADHVDGVVCDEETDAALVEDNLPVREDLVGTGYGVGIDPDLRAPFPDRGDAPSGLEFPGKDPLTDIVRDLDVDGFVTVKFHNFNV